MMKKCKDSSLVLKEIDSLELAIRKLRAALCVLDCDEDSLLADVIADTFDNLRALEISLNGDAGQPVLRNLLT